MIDITPIINAIIALLAAIVTVKVIPWIKARTTNEQQANIKAVVKTLVFAAEQLYGAGGGAEKLAWVTHELKTRGYTVDPVEIEAAVAEHLNYITTTVTVDGPTQTPSQEAE